LAFPASNALLLQGPVLILGATIGGSAIATFSAFRTLARIPIQLTSVLNSSVWPEMSSAYGAQNFELLKRLHRATVASATYAALAASALILAFGPFIIKTWLHGKIGYDVWLMSGLLAASALNAIWNASGIVLVATNLHNRLGAIILIASAASVLAYYPAAVYFNLYGIAMVMVCTEIVLASFVRTQSLMACQDSFKGLVLAVLHAPVTARAAIHNMLYSACMRRVVSGGEPPKSL
jgi:O-antigen/teichoic acid export membrane protein